jgi:ketosteroid isomerase-like protein
VASSRRPRRILPLELKTAGRAISRAGDIDGRADLIAWLEDVRALGFTLREHDVFASDQHVCALSYMGTRRPGVDVETRVVSIFHFRQGRQIERWFFPEDLESWDRIFDTT